MNQLYTFKDLITFSFQQIRQAFGGKALGLYEAHLLSINVPTPFFVSTELHKTFIEKREKDGALFIRNTLKETLNALENRTYAVRSSCQTEDSSEMSYAGIFESFLDVPREKIPEAILQVWNSSYEKRAESYQKGQTLMGVVIQPMVHAKFAGICFTKHPSPKDLHESTEMVIEFAHASGEKIVQGEIIPFLLTGSPDILSSATEHPWIDELIQASFELKKYYHHEADIEFTIDVHDQFWLLQQRPISKIIPTKTLNLSGYTRMYKRTLLALDIELLIDGCSRFLAPYLEVPINLERWMVMITQDAQELWVHNLLNESVLRAVVDKIEHNPDYLPRIQKRYQDHHQRLKGPFPKQLFEWFEWITPFTAHYYVPMFIIEALHISLLREIRHIDPENSEKDLFDLATLGVPSMVDLLNEKLRPLKNRTFEEIRLFLNETLEIFGFMKCRQVFEDPYTAEELFEMIRDVPEKPTDFDRKGFEEKKKKYFHQKHLELKLNQLREWIRIRNQEMEFLLKAFLSARPIFNQVCTKLHIDLETFWRSSKESLLKAYVKTPVKDLTIFQQNGQTILSDKIEIQFPELLENTDLKGRTVYGKGIIDAEVYIAFSPEELKTPPKRPCVLVTGMTTPDFVPLIRNNFDALITDEGGILSHAAIVAREIPINCIVGTGMATNLLKNGSRIRIDFDQGTIQQIT